MMLNSSASQGSPALPLIGPTPTIPIPVETESGGVILFDWPVDTASGIVTVRTDQGALVFQAPFPVPQAGPFVDSIEYFFTWEGTYTNGQTFSQTGSTTVLETSANTETPSTVDYSLPENAEQIGVPQHELQYPVFEATGIPPMPEDPNVAFEDLIFTQRVFWFAQRMHNEADYINEMRTDMQIMAADFNYNTATRNRAAVNAAFLANVGNLGANETLRGYVNWILHVNDGKSISYWDGWHGAWLSVQEWYDTLVPANFKASLVNPSG